MIDLKCFKSYDIRGKVPQELNNDLAYKIGIAYAAILQPKKIVTGYDVRLESQELQQNLIQGLTDSGVNVLNIRLCGTEEIYYQAFANPDIDGGIMITASHNPKGYNGMKMVGKGARPISLDDDLQKIKDYIINNISAEKSQIGTQEHLACKDNYIAHLLEYIDVNNIKPLKVVVNPGNGPAGIIIEKLAKSLPLEFVYINETPDGNFPNGVPNPMIIENRKVTSDAVVQHGADFGIAWDGDFDRCFLFDEKGSFIEGYYVVGLLAANILKKHPGEKIVHDPRLIWNTLDIVTKNNGIALQSKSGHSFIKNMMRQENAAYGGEMSAHHYFREFGYCDSGMIPWLLVTELLCSSGQKLSDMVRMQQEKFPCSGEINYTTDQFEFIVEKILLKYKDSYKNIDQTDGLSVEFDQWRFNIRKSNTESLIRLNVETKGDKKNLQDRVLEIESIIYSN
ncbi:MAG: hypothetical protein DGJ47_000748 [Rickettsiaceae bacterium]